MKIEILGSGCPNCVRVYDNVVTAVKESGLQAEVVKVEDMDKILGYKVISTPALVIDGEVKSAGRVLSVAEVKALLTPGNETPEASCGTNEECCCGGPVKNDIKYIPVGYCCCDSVETPAGKIPRVYKEWKFSDYAGAWLVRLGWDRMGYGIAPGLYAFGAPDKNSPVLVSANYKLSFDVLRRELKSINAWILVIDSKAVNVWCSAGKGTFSAEEIARVVKEVKLDHIVSHKTLILPQLSAPGVAAFELIKLCGFKGIFGPVEARDIKKFIDNGMKADGKMREVKFGLFSRLEVAVLELAGAVPYLLAIMLVSGIAWLWSPLGIKFFIAFSGAAVAGVVAGSLIFSSLLPVMPGRMFSVKGGVLGAASGLILAYLLELSPVYSSSIIAITAAVSAFVAMNYTGASTFTSITGVKKEVAVSLPVIIVMAALGLIVQIMSFFVKGIL